MKTRPRDGAAAGFGFDQERVDGVVGPDDAGRERMEQQLRAGVDEQRVGGAS